MECQRDTNYKVTVKDIVYAVILHPDTEVGGYWIECPELDVASQGETVEESLDMIAEAIELSIEYEETKVVHVA